MIFIIPVRSTSRVISKLFPLFIFMVLLSAGSAFVGNTAIWLFTAPKLLSAIHLLAIPVALIAGALMVGFTREMFKTDANEDGFFALGGLPSVFVFLVTLLAVGGGLWFGGIDGVNTRNYRLSEIYMRSRASEIAAQQKESLRFRTRQN